MAEEVAEIAEKTTEVSFLQSLKQPNILTGLKRFAQPDKPLETPEPEKIEKQPPTVNKLQADLDLARQDIQSATDQIQALTNLTEEQKKQIIDTLSGQTRLNQITTETATQRRQQELLSTIRNASGK